MSRLLRRFTAAAMLVLGLATAVSAHDVPPDITVQAFIKPDGERLRFLVRVPLEAMRDVNFPQRGPGYLDLTRIDGSLRDAAMLWIGRETEIYENDVRLAEPRIVAILASLPSDRSFAAYDSALVHVSGPPLDSSIDIYWSQAMLDVLFEYPIRSADSRFSIRPGLRRLGLQVTTGLRFVKPDGAIRAFELRNDPGLVRLDPRWQQAASRFIQSGFAHILQGTDHLLFLLCLVIPLRRIRPLVGVVTAFTVAHSITLIASAYGFAPSALWFPPLVETLIAVSIVYMALENIIGGARGHRWLVAFGFGLVHGFGFSFALRESLQFAGVHLLSSLLSFNLGVEAGQLVVLAAFLAALALLFRFVVTERMGTIIVSVLVAHTAWHWMLERGERLAQFPVPVFDPLVAATAVRALMIAITLAALAWLGLKTPALALLRRGIRVPARLKPSATTFEMKAE